MQDPDPDRTGGITVESTEVHAGDSIEVVVAGNATTVEVVREGTLGVDVVPVPASGVVSVSTNGVAPGGTVTVSDGRPNGDRVDIKVVPRSQ